MYLECLLRNCEQRLIKGNPVITVVSNREKTEFYVKRKITITNHRGNKWWLKKWWLKINHRKPRHGHYIRLPFE